MTRYAVILAALRVVAPRWDHMVETAWELERLEAKYHVRAELVMVIARHESQWQPWVVNSKSGTTGLLQIQPFSFKGCKESGDLESTSCSNARLVLVDWQSNLRIGFEDYRAARDYCIAHGYGGRAQQWLQMPTGFDATQHATCGYKNGKRLPIPKMVLDLLREASQLGWTKKTVR